MDKILSWENKQEALFFLEWERRRRSDVYWTTQAGNKINIKEMTDKHLLNTIRKLKEALAEWEIVSNGID